MGNVIGKNDRVPGSAALSIRASKQKSCNFQIARPFAVLKKIILL
jgi:hypothetical protein